MSAGFVLRSPWYQRIRDGVDLRDPRALRPALQKYGDERFATRMLADPRDSLAFDDEDTWSYPVPAGPGGKGRERFATHVLHRTRVTKLFQPTHDRFYTVVVEVFCDQPGLPMAGGHDELEVGFVMRRRRTLLNGDRSTIRRLARDLIVAQAKRDGRDRPAALDPDAAELAAAEAALDQQFIEDHLPLLDAIDVEHDVQSWMVNADGGLWRHRDAAAPPGERARHEEVFRMWRLPPSAAACPRGANRSLWFGVVPTFSAEHWIPDPTKNEVAPKLDEHEIYELVCFVRQPLPPGHGHCPPRIWWSTPTRPFRLAAPFDPDGTKNHSVTITAPDLRRLAARAGGKLGPGGVRIVTPPGSALTPPGVGGLGKVGSPPAAGGGGVCLFAFELFFMVALFLFLLFLPIVVLAFQLWWMLALRFCIPPTIAFSALATFLAAHGDQPLTPADLADDGKKLTDHFDAVLQMPGATAEMQTVDPFKTKPTALGDLVAAIDPAQSVADPVPPEPEAKPDDPLCAGPSGS